MLRPSALIAVLLCAAGLPAAAQDFGPPAAQVALQPLPETPTPDIEALLKSQWKAYYNGGGRHGFFRDQVRAGRIDLNEDGAAELFVLIDAPEWQTDRGLPMMVARWTSKGWSPIGGGFADPDSVFVITGRVQGWATIETPSQWLRWNGISYQMLDKTPR
jgi:hypothetical protein